MKILDVAKRFSSAVNNENVLAKRIKEKEDLLFDIIEWTRKKIETCAVRQEELRATIKHEHDLDAQKDILETIGDFHAKSDVLEGLLIYIMSKLTDQEREMLQRRWNS